MKTRLALAALVLLSACRTSDPCGNLRLVDGVCLCPEGTMQVDGGVCEPFDAGMMERPDARMEDAGPIACAGASPIVVYADADADGHGNPATERMGCPGEPGTVTLGDDCDDACAACHPGGTEICDGSDNDCANGPDDTFACARGTRTACTTSCGSTGATTCTTECALPAATCEAPSETCNEVDDDCDAIVDEGTLGVGSAVPWPDVQGFNAVVATAGGFVAFYTGGLTDGLTAQRFAADATPSGAPVPVYSGHVDGVDATLLTADEIAWVVEDGDLALLGSVRVADLTPLIAARTVASHTSLSAVRLVRAGPLMLVYSGAGGGIYSRTFLMPATESPAERTIVTSRSGTRLGFDVTSVPTTIARVYVAYEDTPAGSTNPTVFTIAADETGALGAGHRVTTDTRVQSSPVITATDGGRLLVAWIDRGDTASVTGDLRAATLTSTGSAWTEVARTATPLATPSGLLTGQLRAIPDRGGWLISYIALLAGAAGSEQRVRAVAPSLAPAGPELVPEPGASGFTDVAVGLLRGATGAWLVTGRANPALSGGAVRAFPLGCL